jgi:hypothetical protein
MGTFGDASVLHRGPRRGTERQSLFASSVTAPVGCRLDRTFAKTLKTPGKTTCRTRIRWRRRGRFSIVGGSFGSFAFHGWRRSTRMLESDEWRSARRDVRLRERCASPENRQGAARGARVRCGRGEINLRGHETLKKNFENFCIFLLPCVCDRASSERIARASRVDDRRRSYGASSRSTSRSSASQRAGRSFCVASKSARAELG